MEENNKEIDWPSMIGRMVEVKDYNNDEWKGPYILQDVVDDEYMFDAMNECWKIARLCEAPTTPNFIKYIGQKDIGNGPWLVRTKIPSLRVKDIHDLMWWEDWVTHYTEIKVIV